MASSVWANLPVQTNCFKCVNLNSAHVTVAAEEEALAAILAAAAVELAALAVVKAEASFCSPCYKEVTHHHQVGVL